MGQKSVKPVAGTIPEKKITKKHSSRKNTASILPSVSEYNDDAGSSSRDNSDVKLQEEGDGMPKVKNSPELPKRLQTCAMTVNVGNVDDSVGSISIIDDIPRNEYSAPPERKMPEQKFHRRSITDKIEASPVTPVIQQETPNLPSPLSSSLSSSSLSSGPSFLVLASSSPPSASPPSALPARKKPRMLIVDDDLVCMKLVIKTFAKDFDCSEAWNGLEALDLICKHNFDIILMDYNLGGNHEISQGNLVISIIRRLENNNTVEIAGRHFTMQHNKKNSIIFGYSSNSDKHTASLFMDAGATAVFVKPQRKQAIIDMYKKYRSC